MELEEIRQLYDYNRWANHRVLSASGALDAEALLRPMGNSFSSLRDTLAHIIGAEWIWLERWLGRFPKALLDPDIFPTLRSLEDRWERVESDRISLSRLSPENAWMKTWLISTASVSGSPIRCGNRWSMW